MIGENTPPDEGWQLPARCCGEWLASDLCPVCHKYTPRASTDGRGTE